MSKFESITLISLGPVRFRILEFRFEGLGFRNWGFRRAELFVGPFLCRVHVSSRGVPSRSHVPPSTTEGALPQPMTKDLVGVVPGSLLDIELSVYSVKSSRE